jgi:glycosyltransferase involved in cell wall biosynthesis
MNPRFSIIVPVYNAEKYLHNCINSIRVQSCANFEVLFVDDGSTDDTLHLLGKFKSEDIRFQLYHQDHRGVSSARNVGLKYAVGDFICFVDADDQIASTYLEDLYQAMRGADSSMSGFKKTDLLSHEDCVIVPQNKIETLEENLSGIYASGPADWQRYLWNRMFKRTIIQQNKLRFREDIFYKEDGLFVVQYLCASNGYVGCVDKVLYYYFRNTTGAMSKTWNAFDKKIITNLMAHKLMIDELRHNDISEIVLSKAMSQAKAACNWVLQMMCRSQSFSLTLLIRIERIMISILGRREYFFWRTTQIGKLFK